jgi:hypothetical protein
MTIRQLLWLGSLLVAGSTAATISVKDLAAQSSQGQAGMVPFTMELRRGAVMHSPVDVSYLLDAPAGKHGFVQVKDGHLATADGHRIRFWGVNITDWSKGSRQIPAREDAAFVAGTLARFGVNSVRFQFLDLEEPRGLISKQGDSTTTFDTGALDREDYFIAELEKRGIYIDFNLLVGRPFRAGDGVKDAEMLKEGAKGTSLYDARLIELQKDYARQLLTHRNPYTKLSYTNDPAIAIVEINNENAINVGFHAPSVFYQDELREFYNQWLAKHRDAAQMNQLREMAGVGRGEVVPLLQSKGQAAQSAPERFYVEAEFFNDLQREYFLEMEHYLKQTLGVRSLVMATADHSHSSSGYPILLATQGMDVIDGHTYWQHPEYYVKKLPMVNDPFNSTVVELSRSAIAGKPYTVSEVNNPFPNDYAGEGIPILAAYAGLQDWDGIFWYTFEPKSDPAWKPYVGDAFDISLDPVKMPELAAGALMFLRGDVAKAHSVNERTYSEKQVFDSMLIPATERPYFTESFPLALPLEHEVRIGSLDGSQTKPFEKVTPTDPIVSDTKELAWQTGADHKAGLVMVDTPRSQALIGFIKGQGKTLRNMTVEVSNNFCTILLSSMDDQPIASSAKLLLTAGGSVENTGQRWNSAGTDVTSFGTAPTLVEPVKGTMTLLGLEGARAVRVQPLDGAGQPLGELIDARISGGMWGFSLGSVTTTWYEIRVER